MDITKPMIIVATPWFFDRTMLLGSPWLRERIMLFSRTVLFVIPRPDGGHFGFIFNSPGRIEMLGFPSSTKAIQIFGGPLQHDPKWPDVWITTADWSFPGEPIADGIWLIDLNAPFTKEYVNTVDEQMRKEDGPSKFIGFHGRAGWDPGQLEHEAVDGFSWFVLEPDPEIVFTDDPEGLWERLVIAQGYSPEDTRNSLAVSRGSSFSS